jgi:predicted nucleic acid-binding protein
MARTAKPSRHGRVREAPEAKHAPIRRQEALNGVLLDSDVIIEILRGNSATSEVLRSIERSGVPTYCTAVSWAEIYAGVRRGEEPLTEEFLHARGEVVLDARAGRQAGAYLASFARSHGVEIADALIAAAASTSGLRLWTMNRRHYPMRDVRFFEPASD